MTSVIPTHHPRDLRAGKICEAPCDHEIRKRGRDFLDYSRPAAGRE
jgi:hypothetical protein